MLSYLLLLKDEKIPLLLIGSLCGYKYKYYSINVLVEEDAPSLNKKEINNVFNMNEKDGHK